MRVWLLSACGVCVASLLLTAVVTGGSLTMMGGPVVPGTGEKIMEVGDDFEDPKWEYSVYLPKASSNIDGQDRLPAGQSANGRIYESTYRGTPEVVKRVATPPGGIPGSKASLVMRSLYTGIPNFPDGTMQQDDLMVNVNARLGGFLPVRWSPSMVVRVFLPPFEYWEQRTGTTFAIRADVRGTMPNPKPQPTRWGHRANPMLYDEPYWPGIFIQFNSKRDQPNGQDTAMLLIRAGSRGEDIVGPVIKETGWWTLGMSFTPDGRVHYYA